MSRAFRIVTGVVFAPLFALSVAVQLNDPDPALWILYYASAFALCVAVILNKRAFIPALVVGAIGFVWAATLAPSLVKYVTSDHPPTAFYMKTGDTLEEEARECGGLLLAASWSLAIAFASRKKP